MKGVQRHSKSGSAKNVPKDSARIISKKKYNNKSNSHLNALKQWPLIELIRKKVECFMLNGIFLEIPTQRWKKLSKSHT